MKKKILIGLLSASLLFASVPAVTVMAEPETGSVEPEVAAEPGEEPGETPAETPEVLLTAEPEGEENGSEPEEVVSQPVLTAVLSADEKIISVSAGGTDPNAAEVSFAVWSASGGQDDLAWIPGQKQENGAWTAEIPVKGHKTVGKYLIHCYQTINGEKRFVTDTQVTVSAPSAEVIAESVDTKKGSITFRVSSLQVPSGIQDLKAAVWGNAGDQNDLVWHEAEKDGEDYLIKVSAGQHRYETGKYFAHVYVTDGNGYFTFAGSGEAEMAFEKSLKAELSADEKNIQVTAAGTGEASKVSFAVWSDANGQDDLTWTDGKKNSDGEWTASVPVKGHKNTGTIQIHCYAEANGAKRFFDAAKVEVSAPSAEVTVESVNEKDGEVTVRISNVSAPAGIEKVQVAAWGEQSGQNDLVWHTAQKDNDDYIAVISAAQHLYEDGNYDMHCYLTDGNGVFSFAGAAEAAMSFEKGVKVSVDPDQMNARIGIIGGASSKMRAAVWHKADQSDLAWFDLKKNGDSAAGVIPITQFRSSGVYQVHIYNGNKFFAGATFTIDPVSAAKLEVSSIDGTKGTFRVTLSGVQSVSGVDKVRIPAWPGSDTGKFYWYTAKKAGDGSYYVDVAVSNHKNIFGKYDIHAYVYAKNGVSNFCVGTTARIEAKNYLYVEETGTYTRRVCLLNPDGDVKKVQFPTWSNTNGQDDCVWYNGTQKGNMWYADVKSANHRHDGTYSSHCYVTYAGDDNAKFAGAVSYKLARQASNHNQAMYDLAQRFSSDTQFLILVNRSIHRVAVYQGSAGNWKELYYWPCVVGKPSTPTPAGTFKIKGRFDWFGDGHKCWWATQIEGYYYFHTQIYYWDDAPRRILDGTMDAAASMGCIRLQEPNARWIYTTVPRGTTVHIF